MRVTLKHGPARAEGIRNDAIRSRVDIAAMDFLNAIGVCDVPVFAATTLFESREHELGTHCPVTDEAPLARNFLNEFSHDAISGKITETVSPALS
jgi:hypothetical protein